MRKGSMRGTQQWEISGDRGEERAASMALRHRTERTISRKRPLVGNKFDAALLPHVQAFISKLEVSPFGEPVISPGRRTFAPRTREGSKKKIGTSSNIPREGINRPSTECTISEEPSAATEGCRSKVEQRRSIASSCRTSGAPPAPNRLRGVTCSETRPTGLPVAHPGGKFPFSRGSSSRQPLSAAHEEAKLLEKLASLSGVQHKRREYPMVDSLKTAVAIEAVQARLRECRCRAKKIKSEHRECAFVDQSTEQKATAMDTPADSSTTCRWALGKSGSFRKLPRSWANRSYFVPVEDGSLKYQSRSERPRSASSIVYTSTSLIQPFKRANPRTATDAAVEVSTTLMGESRCAARNLQDSFQRLTIGSLIELNRMHNPPRPVLDVMTALGHLLGLRKRKGGYRRPLCSTAYCIRAQLAAVCPRRISPRRLSSLVRRLESPELAPVRVKGASAAAILVLDWLLAVVACARAEGISMGEPTKADPGPRSRWPRRSEEGNADRLIVLQSN